MDHAPTGWRWMALWTGLTLAGLGCGFAAASLTTRWFQTRDAIGAFDRVVFALGIFVWACVLGAFQALALKGVMPRAWRWIAVTGSGFVVSLALGLVTDVVLGMRWLLAPLVALAPGAAQFLVLRTDFARAWYWLFASALGLGSVPFFLLVVDDGGWREAAVDLAAFLPYALVTGWVLLRLRRVGAEVQAVTT